MGTADFSFVTEFAVDGTENSSGTNLTFNMWSGNMVKRIGLDGPDGRFYYEGGNWGDGAALGNASLNSDYQRLQVSVEYKPQT